MKAKTSAFVIDHKRFWTILSVILVLGMMIKLVRLSDPPDFYFDEVYHGFTATYYLNGNHEAYSMYHKNPPGRAVEWTHPPLAKLFMTAGMMVFGENSFGWRVSSVVFGAILIMFAALVARELFNSAFIALITAFLLSIEGLIFTQSRIAMNDAHLMAFVYMAFYFYIRWRKNAEVYKYLIWTGVATGLALSCKWSALFVFMIIGIERLYSWYRKFELPSLKEFAMLTLSLVIIPAAVYVASYAHFFWLGYTWDELVNLQRSMWWYHTNLKATHPYMSKPYHWLFNLRPVWMYVDYSVEGRIGNIYNIGNGIILYFGLASVVMAILELRRQFVWEVWFCVLAYFMVWLPWIFSPRIMLFYHYAPAVPMLCILFSRQLERLWMTNHRVAVRVVLASAVLWFALFYPHHTAIPLPKEFVESIYYIVPSWR
jgi:dolichyl-phosphate-mannose-protein mannosyltransferase